MKIFHRLQRIIPTLYSSYLFKLFIQALYSSYLFKLFIQAKELEINGPVKLEA